MNTTLTVGQLDSFKKNGYLLIKNFFPSLNSVEAANWLKSQDQASLAKTWTDQEPGVPLAVLQNIHKGDTPIAKLAQDKNILQTAAELIGEEVYIWSSKVNVKAAWCGTVEYFHQDYAYWNGRGYEQYKMLTCMTFIDPHSPYNGGLQVFPGSHEEGFLDHVDFINTNGLAKFMISPKKLDELNEKYGMEAIHANPGDVLFFHAGLVHGSSHNISPQTRMIILSQLNTVNNKPVEVREKAIAYNLARATKEVNEAKRRLAWFERKYDEQFNSNDVTFNSPIPDAERK
jgi:ectoine hydroxylase